MIRSRNLGWALARLQMEGKSRTLASSTEVLANIAGRIAAPRHLDAELVIMSDGVYVLEHPKFLNSSDEKPTGAIHIGGGEIESLVVTHSLPGWLLGSIQYPPRRLRSAQGNRTSLRFRTRAGEDVTFVPEFDQQLKAILPLLVEFISDKEEIYETILNALPELERLLARLPDNKLGIVECLFNTDGEESFHSRPGFLVVSSQTYSFLEQGHLNGELTLKSHFDSRDRKDLVACTVTVPSLSTAPMNPLAAEINFIEKLDPNLARVLSLDATDEDLGSYVELSFGDESWVIGALDGERQRIFEMQAASVLSMCAWDIGNLFR